MTFGEIKVRSYEKETDRVRMEDLERRCEVVGPSDHLFILSDTLGDPISRIRNSPLYIMLVAECNNELVGAIQGSIKVVTLHQVTHENLAKVGYILGLRVSPQHRRRDIGSVLVHHLEQWFVSNQADYAYMATEKSNRASINLFVKKLGYTPFRTPTILVHPVNNKQPFSLTSKIEIEKLRVEKAEFFYRKFMGSVEFFPQDIDKVLENKLSLGTWVAYYRKSVSVWTPNALSDSTEFSRDWAMLSVWNSGEILKLRIGQEPFSCLLYNKGSRLSDRVFPCMKFRSLPDFSNPFGFYFVYGVHREGPDSGKLVRALFKFVHNMVATTKAKDDNKVMVTEVGGSDKVRAHITHWKLLSCPQDLWCIRELEKDGEKKGEVAELRRKSQLGKSLFVDPREI